jgi:PAS domain S-box-containing protein
VKVVQGALEQGGPFEMGDSGDAGPQAARSGALVQPNILAALPQPEFDHVARMAARLLDMPIALIALIDDTHKWLISCIGAEISIPPHSVTFCDHAIAQRGTLVVPDTLADPRFAGNALVTGPAGIRCYAGALLIDPAGHAVGTLCVMDQKPRERLTADQCQTLEDLAQMVIDRMELHLRNREAHKAAGRTVLQGDILRLVLEAPDFTSACSAAAEYLRQTSDALFCRLFRLAPDGESVDFVAGAGKGNRGDDTVRADLGTRRLTIHNSVVGRSLSAGKQIVVPDLCQIDPDESPLTRSLLVRKIVSLIVTPFRMLDERHAIVLGFGTKHSSAADLAECAEMSQAAVETLRPMLRRLKDEAETTLFRRVVECCPDPVMITEAIPLDEPGPRIIYCNDAFLAQTGYSREQVIGRSPRFLQGPDTEPEARAYLRAALRNRQPVRQVILNYRADGTPFHCELNLAPVVDQTGWHTHLVAVQRDVTAERNVIMLREAALREMQAMFEAMPGAMLRYRRDCASGWRKCFISTSIEALTGYPVSEAMLSGWARQHVREVDYHLMMEQLQVAFDTGSANAEFRFRHRDGRLLLIHNRMCSFLAADGTREVVGVWADVTRERGLAAQLDQAAKLAELGEMAAGLAHELNRPLAGINLAAENALRALARLPEATQRVHDKLTTISDMAMRAAQVVRHIQVFGRLDRGDTVPVALAALLDDMMILAQAKLLECNVTVQFDVPDNLPQILVRPIPLEQVLINLVANACDAYATAEPRIALAERQISIKAEAGGRGVTIWVRDRAGGVPEAALPYLFDAFFTTKPAGKGTGLGLSISAGIVKEMGGSLCVHNKDGGAVFVLDLPSLPD